MWDRLPLQHPDQFAPADRHYTLDISSLATYLNGVRDRNTGSSRMYFSDDCCVRATISRANRPAQFGGRSARIGADLFRRGANDFAGDARVNAVPFTGCECLFHTAVFPGMK